MVDTWFDTIAEGSFVFEGCRPIIPLGPNCCSWLDSNAPGGTVNGCTCRDTWALQDATVIFTQKMHF